jgi:DNA-binding NtrC family response regulator
MLANKRGKILVVDNDQDVLLALERTLEDRGYDTAAVLSQEEAFKLLAEDSFDLFVLDDYLSDKDSIQLLTEFRQLGMTPRAIVTYHRYPLPYQVEHLRALGVIAFINKRAHSELAQTVDDLFAPPPGWKLNKFDYMT